MGLVLYHPSLVDINNFHIFLLYWWLYISYEYEGISLGGDVASNQIGSSGSSSHCLGRTHIIFGIFIGFFHRPLIRLALVFD